MLNVKDNVSIGMLKLVGGFPAEGLPVWANTFGLRMQELGVKVSAIKLAIEEMEITRRRKYRNENGSTNITDFDTYIAAMMKTIPFNNV